jgi:hypothetical protein
MTRYLASLPRVVRLALIAGLLLVAPVQARDRNAPSIAGDFDYFLLRTNASR